VLRLRSRRALLLASSLLGAACASPPPLPPPEVEYAGCRAVLEPGMRCVLREKRELVLWVGAAAQQRVTVLVDGKPAAPAVVAVSDGQRFTLDVAGDARRVEVRATAPRPTAAWWLDFEAPAHHLPQRDVVADVFAKTALSYRQLAARDLVAARATLDAVQVPAKSSSGMRYLVRFHRGLLAEREGDYRTALAEVRGAAQIVERVGAERYQWLAEEELALLLRGLGRSREAAELFDRLRRTPHPASPCEEGQLLNNQAWSMLLAREAGDGADDPTPLLHEALAKFERCSEADAERRVNVLVNLALAQLQDGRPRVAAELLRRGRTLEAHPPLPHLLWWLDLEGRIDLAERRPAAALRRFAELEELSAETASFDGALRAAHGQARAQRALANPAAAFAVLRRAESLLDAESLQVPAHEGRETFFAARRSIVSLHLEMLLDDGRAAEALTAARRARSRVLRQLVHVDSLASLPAADRIRRARLLTDYQQARAALETRAADDWKLPADELDGERAARKAEAQRLQRLLDEAFSILGDTRPASTRELPPPRAGELLLAYHPLSGRAWVGFAADATGVAAHRFALPPGSLPAAEELAAALLEPFRGRIERAKRLRILASGQLENVAFHALPLAGDALLARRPVVYGLDLPAIDGTAAAPGGNALVVTDPRGDLPGAREEGRTVRQALTAATQRWRVEELTAEEADAAVVQRRLATADLLHYAGHGSYSGLGGWESSLLLAGDTQLTLGDLLALGRVPPWVVLAGCDTGRSSGESAVVTLGLAHAFLLAGARDVVASTRPAYDRDMPRFFADLYSQWDREPDLAAALQHAELAWRRRDGNADWAGFRLFER